MAVLHVASFQFPEIILHDLKKDILENFEKVIELYPDKNSFEEASAFLLPPQLLLEEFRGLVKALKNVPLTAPPVLCHLDLHPRNIILSDFDGSLHFIDYEFAGFDYLESDIGGFLSECLGET